MAGTLRRPTSDSTANDDLSVNELLDTCRNGSQLELIINLKTAEKSVRIPPEILLEPDEVAE